MSTPLTPRSRSGPAGRRISTSVAAGLVAGVALAAVGAAAPAVADSGAATVTLSTTAANTNGRTLVLNNLSGSPLSTSSGLSADSGTAGFITGVTDANYSNFGYTVGATMTNLYKSTGVNTYDCGTSIPSGNVTVAEKGALDLTNITTSFQPLFSLAGPVLTQTLAPTPLAGKSQTLSGTSLLGATNGALTDIADGTLSGLPVKAAAGIAGNSSSAFTNPAAFSLSGTTCTTAGGATVNPLLAGTSNKAGVQSVQNTILNTLGGGTSFNAKTLTDAAYTTVDAVKALAAPLVGGLGLLSTLNIALLTASLTTLQNMTQSGSYQVSPTLNVSLPPTVATGQYVGIMTVTLADS